MLRLPLEIEEILVAKIIPEFFAYFLYKSIKYQGKLLENLFLFISS